MEGMRRFQMRIVTGSIAWMSLGEDLGDAITVVGERFASM